MMQGAKRRRITVDKLLNVMFSVISDVGAKECRRSHLRGSDRCADMSSAHIWKPLVCYRREPPTEPIYRSHRDLLVPILLIT